MIQFPVSDGRLRTLRGGCYLLGVLPCMERNALLLGASTRGLGPLVSPRSQALGPGGLPGNWPSPLEAVAAATTEADGPMTCVMALLPGGYGGLELDDERAASVGVRVGRASRA